MLPTPEKVPHQQLRTCLPNHKGGKQESKEATAPPPRNFVLKYNLAHHSIPDILIELEKLQKTIFDLGSRNSSKLNEKDMFDLILQISAISNSATQFKMEVREVVGTTKEQTKQLNTTLANLQGGTTTHAAAAKVLIRPVVFVTPIEKTSKLTAEETTAKFNNAINSADVGVNIKRIRPTRTNAIVIEAQNKEGLAKAQKPPAAGPRIREQGLDTKPPLRLIRMHLMSDVWQLLTILGGYCIEFTIALRHSVSLLFP
ncbi:hypothetical protein FQA39_LY04012 [Lamprigera yunnana]|nr:hypothetical protein FQA39_LY04012 [Lamprigera yunnana]